MSLTVPSQDSQHQLGDPGALTSSNLGSEQRPLRGGYGGRLVRIYLPAANEIGEEEIVRHREESQVDEPLPSYVNQRGVTGSLVLFGPINEEFGGHGIAARGADRPGIITVEDQIDRTIMRLEEAANESLILNTEADMGGDRILPTCEAAIAGQRPSQVDRSAELHNINMTTVEYVGNNIGEANSAQFNRHAPNMIDGTHLVLARFRDFATLDLASPLEVLLYIVAKIPCVAEVATQPSYREIVLKISGISHGIKISAENGRAVTVHDVLGGLCHFMRSMLDGTNHAHMGGVIQRTRVDRRLETGRAPRGRRAQTAQVMNTGAVHNGLTRATDLGGWTRLGGFSRIVGVSNGWHVSLDKVGGIPSSAIQPQSL
ncbi:hypothetical protein SISNIDRAFT_491897 [Sistotremastrum niveocremeum HHB9708]|uniref:DUF6699 domain-containing protein n=1 Tax=Sistotremastrum niveocremeum HHB9708 TaxID=1314777 RepID=A0A164MA45_9AGAM|nr:hypothetical protein SISNIDRAFT_491897 [Sistotremastrum niveocremeum HHB9708]